MPSCQKSLIRDLFHVGMAEMKTNEMMLHTIAVICDFFFLILLLKVSIILDTHWGSPKDPHNAADVDAAERYMQFSLGWFAHPIYIDGDYPQVMKEFIKRRSFGSNRLPMFTKAEMQSIKGVYVTMTDCQWKLMAQQIK